MRPFRCTYRLQLGPHLDFRGARKLVPYLHQLGVSHLYLSPSFQARAGSTHGYDVVDPTHISEDLGGEEEFRALCGAALGVILDVVPNHMAASEDENPFWRDPLMRAKFFDLDWRTGVSRRFFDIGELAGVRMEDPEVFETLSRKVIELARDGAIDGVRVDHPDGLANPAQYLRRLREAGIEQIWVEKILETGEQLRDWPVEGTTGYEFANDVTALFVDPAAEEPLTHLYRRFTGEQRDFEEIAAEAKLEQARTTFDPEVDWLAARLGDAGEGVDLAAALASFRVYRTWPPRRRLPCGEPRARAALPATPPRDADPRHQAKRGRSRPTCRADVDSGGMASPRGGTARPAGGRPERRLSRPAERGRSMAADSRAAGRVRPEGAPRGQAKVELARAGRALRAARPGVRLVAARRDRAVRAPARADRRADRPGSDDAQADVSGRARHLSGRRARVAEPGRPRQSTPGRLGRQRRALADPPPKLRLIRDVLAAGVEREYEPFDAGPGVCAFVRGSRHLVAVPVRPGAWVMAPPRWPDLFGGWLFERG